MSGLGTARDVPHSRIRRRYPRAAGYEAGVVPPLQAIQLIFFEQNHSPPKPRMAPQYKEDSPQNHMQSTISALAQHEAMSSQPI